MAGSPGNATYLHGMAIAYEFRGRNMWLLGDRTAALAGYLKSLEVANRLLAKSPGDLTSLSQRLADKGPIATLLALAGDRAGALKMTDELMQQAVELSLQHSGLHIARAWWWCGQTREALHDFPEAAAAYEKSLEAWKKLPAMSGIPQYQAEMREVLHKAAQCKAKIPRNARQAAGTGIR